MNLVNGLVHYESFISRFFFFLSFRAVNRLLSKVQEEMSPTSKGNLLLFIPCPFQTHIIFVFFFFFSFNLTSSKNAFKPGLV